MSEEQFYIIPKKGVLLVDPATRKPLPPEGGFVTPSKYWRRRISEGDAVVTRKQHDKQPPKRSAKKEA